MFLRKSREDVEAERAGRFETLAKHEAVLTRLAEDRGLSVVRVYRELVSGASLSDRDEAMAMLSDVRSGAYDGVLAFDLQRITRGDMVDQGNIMRVFAFTGTLIVTPSKVYDPRDELDGNFAELEMLFGRMELARITRRLVAGKEEAVRQGQYIGSLAPYGWDKVDVGRKHTLQPNADNARMVSWYERIAAGEATPREIADEMNETGIPTPRGKLWDRSLVIRIIRNPVNKGYVRWNQKRTVAAIGEGMAKVKRREKAEPIVVKGLHAGTVDDDLWQRANDAIDGRANHVNRLHSLKDPLAGLLVCAGCGRAMQRCRNSKNQHEYYHHPIVNRKACFARGAKVPDVVAALTEALSSLAADVDVDTAVDAGDGATARIELLQKDLEAEHRSGETLFRLVEKGLITDEEFAERRSLSTERAEAIERRIAEARKTQRQASERRRLSVNIRQAIAELSRYAGRAQEVNDFLKSFVERVEYRKDPETGIIHLEVFLK